MKNEKLLNAIGQINDNYIIDAQPREKKQKIAHLRIIIGFAASLTIIVSIISIFHYYSVKQPYNNSEQTNKSYNVFTGGAGKVCSMFLSDKKLFYTNDKNDLFYYDKSIKKEEFISNIEIESGGLVFEEDGFIYYGNGNAIFKRNLKDNTSQQLLSSKNIWLDEVKKGRLFYHIAYKHSLKEVYTEFEYRIYDISTGNDIQLFKRSSDNWDLFDVENNIIIADASLENDSGLFFVDIITGTKKKLLNIRVNEGYLTDNKFFCSSDDDKGLWVISTKEEKNYKIALPGEEKEGFFIDRITGFDDFLYIAAYYEESNKIIKLNLQTYDTSIIADGFGRVWDLCTDGNVVYAYDTKSPFDMGQITVIDIK